MEFSILEFNGEADQVHVLIQYPPKVSISGMVNSLKGVSSRKYGRANLPKPKNRKSLGSPSYFVSSVGGASLETLKGYIQNQQRLVLEGRGFKPNFLIRGHKWVSL